MYRSELAATFDLPRESRERRELLERWRIEAAYLADTETRWGAELDLRAAPSHALYWAERGLRSPRLEEDRYSAAVLRGILPRAIVQLASCGRPIKNPAGRWYAFVPDLRFAPMLRRVLDAEVERLAAHPELLETVRKHCLEERAKLVCSLFLFGGSEEAAREYGEIAGKLSGAPTGVEEFVLESWGYFFSPERASGTSAPGDEFASALAASLYLELTGDDRGARGFRALCDLILSRRMRPRAHVPLPSLDAYLRAAAARLCERWKAQPEVWARIPPGVQARAEGPGPDAAALGLPEPERLPFRLELLDHLFRIERR